MRAVQTGHSLQNELQGVNNDIKSGTCLFRIVLAQSCNPMGCSLPGFSVHEFSREEDWSGLSFPSPGYLPHPGIEPKSPTLLADSLPSEPPGKPF